MQTLMQGEWTPAVRLQPAGETMLGNLVSKGWIEGRQDGKGEYLYKLTDAGRTAFSALIPISK